MVKATSIITMIRPGNAAMAAVAVALGHHLSDSSGGVRRAGLLCGAAVLALGFGNVINDIIDIEGDRINHPDRPLPKGEVSVRTATLSAVVLAVASLCLAGIAGMHYLIPTVIPMVLLYGYAVRLKATPFAGNILVSALVAYALLYGGLGAPKFHTLIVPAFLAFVLNTAREIIKDIQDESGDRRTGVATTATLPEGVLRRLLITLCALYLVLQWLPIALSHFGLWYGLICGVLISPLIIRAMTLLVRSPLVVYARQISLLVKICLAGGLAGMVLDRTITTLS